jgi:hypothetical protein
MKRILITVGLLLVAVSASFAATPTDASLKGNYSIQLTSIHLDQWSASITCPNPGGNEYTLNFGGTYVGNQPGLGVITFDGKGNVTGTVTVYGQFDQTESNATVIPSCTQGAGSNGNAVYDPPSVVTLKGTYSIQSNGTGTMVLALSTGDTNNFVLQLAGTAAVRNTVFLIQFDPNNRVEVSGSATLEETRLFIGSLRIQRS